MTPPPGKKKNDVPPLVGLNVLGRLSSLSNNLDIVPGPCLSASRP